MRHDETPTNQSRRCKVIPTDPLGEDSSHEKPPGVPVAERKRKGKVSPPGATTGQGNPRVALKEYLCVCKTGE